jgi:beta-galactosidase
MAVALVRSAGQPGTITVTATSPGLAAATVNLRAAAPATAARPAAIPGAAGASQDAAVAGSAATLTVSTAPASTAPASTAPASTETAGAAEAGAAAANGPAADASYSGAPDTIPSAMLDGNLSTGWSNYYDKSATANLPAVSVSNPADWVSLTWRQPQRLAGISASFTTSAVLARPAKLAVSYWDGHRFAPVGNPAIGWATASNQPTTVTFDPVSTTALRLDMTSAAPATGAGFLQIAELSATPAR